MDIPSVHFAFSWTNHNSLLCMTTNEVASSFIHNRLHCIFSCLPKRAKLKDFEINKAFFLQQFVSLLYKTNRFHAAMRLFSNKSQKTSKCGKNISGTLNNRLVCEFFFLLHFDVICDLLWKTHGLTLLFFNLHSDC